MFATNHQLAYKHHPKSNQKYTTISHPKVDNIEIKDEQNGTPSIPMETYTQ